MRSTALSSLRRSVPLALLLATGAAQAHTGHDTSSLMAGLAHPLGGDHLLAMLAVGLWSATALPAGKRWQGPATFLLALVLSAFAGMAGLVLPMQEMLVALSVALLGALLVPGRLQPSAATGLALVALAGCLHGLAHGAETPASGFGGYAAGFLASTALLHGAGLAAGLGLRRFLARQSTWLLAAAGGLLGGAGVALALTA